MALPCRRLRNLAFFLKTVSLAVVCLTGFSLVYAVYDTWTSKALRLRLVMEHPDDSFHHSNDTIQLRQPHLSPLQPPLPPEQQREQQHHQQQQEKQLQQHPPPSQQQNRERSADKDTDRNISQTRMAHRRSVAAQYCQKKSKEKGPTPRYRYTSCPLVSRKRRFHLCPIAKIGSTFFTRFHAVLEQEYDGNRSRIRSPFSIPVKIVEGMRCKNSIDNDISSRVVKAMFVRDPFSRIFSAYVDKLISPNPIYWRKWGLQAMALDGQRSTKVVGCGQGVTFSQFLRYVVKSLWRLNNHVIPMVGICDPCKHQYDIIGNMETFPGDLDYMMSLINVTFAPGSEISREAKLDAIYDSIQGPFSWLKRVKACVSTAEMGRRIWRKLQIRGLISSDLDYPLGNADISSMTETEFYDIAVQAHKKSTDKHRLSFQKKQAFIEAFRTVDLKVIEEYVRVYRDDFDAFGYDRRPSSIFQRNVTFTDTKAFDFNRSWRILPSA